MSFHLDWTITARDDLADLWISADSQQRKEITKLIHELEIALQHDPLEVGES